MQGLRSCAGGTVSNSSSEEWGRQQRRLLVLEPGDYQAEELSQAEKEIKDCHVLNPSE